MKKLTLGQQAVLANQPNLGPGGCFKVAMIAKLEPAC